MQSVRKKLRYIALVIGAVFVALISSTLICVIISVIGGARFSTVSLQKIADEITFTENGYVLSDTGKVLLDSHKCFALLIDSSGERTFGYQLPEDIPDHFSIQDINSISRWYLNDYPVTTWNIDESVLVIGYPKNSYFRYPLLMPSSQLKLLFHAFLPCSILIFACVFIFGTRLDRKQRILQDQARTEWIAGVSHDIRTPLTSIIGNAEQLQKAATPTKEQAQQLSSILEQSKRISLLVEDFNLVNKLDYGILDIPKETVKLNAVLRRVAVDLINAGILNDSYDIDLPLSNECAILGDDRLLYRVFYNLILNSIKHNPDGCLITVSLLPKSFRRITVNIADNGKGYPDSILKQNKQHHNPWNTHGLGLLVVSKIIQAYHGRLRLFNCNGAVAEVTMRLSLR